MKSLILILLCSAPLLSYLRGQDMDAGFLVKFKDEVTPHRITGVFLTPGEQMKIETLFEDKDETYHLVTKFGTKRTVSKNVWQWTAPEEKGIYPIVIKESNDQDSMLLNCIVMVPFEQVTEGKLNGFRIGSYPKSTNELYTLPKGFIEVTRANEQTHISPHYTLKDFLCKQQSDYPKYIVLKERGILKLEMVQSYLNSSGLRFSKFRFISGYRTPFYNRSIGNVKNSRHIFGDAYDIYIDENNDAQMDDLNADGEKDKKDVLYLYNRVDELYRHPWFKPFIGGLGLYRANSRHTGFIHIDSRGYRARWGE